LGAIREVVTIYPRRRNQQRRQHQQTVLTKTNELQEQLIKILGMQGPEKHY
jgi:hypothetical protein